MSEPINTPANTPAPNPKPDPAPMPEPAPERAFTQAEVDSAVGKAIARIKKGIPGEEELSAFRAWKESQQTEKERWDTLARERDESKTALAAAQAELEQFRREKFLLGKGVSAEDVDYYAYKIGKQVTDTVDFEKAAEAYLKENPPAGTVTVDLSAPLGGGQPAKTENEMMNGLIRRARK